MADETTLGGLNSRFPTTAWDLLGRSGGPDDVNALAARYWRPVYRFVRSVWRKPVEDAKDLTQEFFATVFTPEFLGSADRRRGNFRQFVLTSLRNFLSNASRADRAQKRGGGRPVLSLDAAADEEPLEPADPADPESAFTSAWAAEVLRQAVAELECEYRASGRTGRFEAFRRYCLDESDPAPTYADLARDHGVTAREIDYWLLAARRDLRALCLRLVRETVADAGDVEEEMARLFGRAP